MGGMNPMVLVKMKMVEDPLALEFFALPDPLRGIVNYEGVYIIVDRVSADGWDWEPTGEPDREDEKPILKALVNTVQTTTTVTKE